MASSRKPAPADLPARAGEFLARRVSPGARLCLGYSGGLDSTVLLHVLAALRETLDFRLTAVHVHHGLSPNADAWAAGCQAVCARLAVPLEIVQVDVLADGRGLEDAARSARYAALAGQDADFVVVAHHADDQAETLLLRLLRGAGARGLSAMAGERPLAESRLLRPLLSTPRVELERYARRHGLDHAEDESNADTALSRNWLRHDVLPLLESRFPSCRSVLARTADRIAEEAALLDDLARIDLAATSEGEALRWAALRALNAPRARNLIRLWLRERTGSAPSSAHLDALLTQAGEAGRDRQPAWRWAGWVVRRHRGRLELGPDMPLPADQWRWHGEPLLDLADHGRLLFQPTVGEGLADRHLPPAGAVVVWRAGGEKLKPDCRRPRRTLKNLLREAGLRPDLRQRLPILMVAGKPVWVAGIGYDCDYQAATDEPGWLISWLPPDRSVP
jgi:tRNA(Ile)-lysidine synthase